MRKNIASVIDAFHHHDTYQDKTCRTDGLAIYSYALLIAVRHGSTVYVLDANESPSQTTSAQIRAVRDSFPGAQTATSVATLERLLASNESVRPVTENAHRDRMGGPDWRGEGAPERE